MIDLSQSGRPAPLDLKFKGDRDYLHGTDMVDAILSAFPDLRDLSVRIQKIATRPITATVLDETVSDRKRLTAIISGRSAVGEISIGLAETDNTATPGRYPYDDSDVVSGAQIDTETRTARMDRNGTYSTIEQCVALQKALLNACFAEPDIRWYFTRLDVSHLPTSFASLSVQVTQALGTNLVRSALTTDGVELGDIYFSGVKT